MKIDFESSILAVVAIISRDKETGAIDHFKRVEIVMFTSKLTLISCR